MATYGNECEVVCNIVTLREQVTNEGASRRLAALSVVADDRKLVLVLCARRLLESS